MESKREDLRNIAIVAHVDHGKTTLVDGMLLQGGLFRENQATTERMMDSGELERERGITILAKNTSMHYKDVCINIVDTPGHADFSGEVERVLQMVDGILLLVDAFEGPMPQTRFVLQKALELGHRVVVVVNKVDRPGARPAEVADEVLELLFELDATEDQLQSPVVYCSARDGWASLSPDEDGQDLRPLLDVILEHMPAPVGDPDGYARALVSCIDYNDYVGRIAVGRIHRGKLRVGQEVALCDYHDQSVSGKFRISAIYRFEGVRREAIEEAQAGDVVAFSGIEGVAIGNTVCDPEDVEPLPFAEISQPTVEMTFMVNDSPFAGKEGKYVTSRHLRDRLFKELQRDVSLEVQATDSPDRFRVLGRGEMHLSILIETMRREGYEFAVGAPKPLYKRVDGKLHEPMERVVADVPESCVGSVIQKLGARKGEMLRMLPQGSRTRLEFSVPARGLLGYRSEFLTDTRGEGIISSVANGYAPFKGEIDRRNTGVLIASETGGALTYGLYNAQERGPLFVGAGVPVYEGMVVGVATRAEDIAVNVCKKKHVTNMRASGSEEALRLTPPTLLSLEQCLEFIREDELLEVTPQSLRIRKQELDHTKRMRAARRAQNEQ